MTKRTADGITTPKSAVRQRTGSNSFSKESYEYDKYGYLTRIVYQRITGNNQKTSGYLTCLYDDYGNRIDGNSYYEYDNTGQWIYRADRDNPKETERVQYIYK